ncbi:MAG: monovalent cation/H(+) antiporter subunit G [Myxococcota bacterium]|nr:monovalent cation/H(+) antiporter subunit G [Myxococcota bacterium]
MSVFIDILAWACLISGSVFCIIGAVGLLRMPNFWTRAHAAGMTDTMGAGLILLGLMLEAGLTLVTVKLLMVLVFLYLTGPTAGHALFRAAHAYGIPFGEVALENSNLAGRSDAAE